jgi:15-cis-phytoene synthase
MLDEWKFPNRATPPGSSAYYSLRFAPRELRDELAALLAWRHQVRAVLEDVSDPGLARIKLQWWREEMGRTFAGAPQHPLTRVLQPALERHGLPPALFIGIADQVELEILRRQPADETELDAACDGDLGALFELIARCHDLDEADLLRTARRLGGFCARVYRIRDSGALARRGQAVLPVEHLRGEGLSAEALTEHRHRSRLPDLLPPAAARARDVLAQSGGKREMPVCIRVRARILESLLDELEQAGFAVADQRLGLTPLRKLWLGWRESRRK